MTGSITPRDQEERMVRPVVLVTGLGGLIGSAVRAHLGESHDLRGLGRRPGPPGVPWHVADIANLDAIKPAFAGVDAVVHLAAALGSKATFDDHVRGNVVGTYNVFEAARQAGVRRVIFASSGATISGIERDEAFRELVEGRAAASEGRAAASEGHDRAASRLPVLTHESPVRPSGVYGCTKVWGEALARHYVDAHGLSVICVRIGAVNAEDRPRAPRELAVWCSQRDIARMIGACLAAPDSVRFDIFFATSRNSRGYRDLTHARDVLGWEPVDTADAFPLSAPRPAAG